MIKQVIINQPFDGRPQNIVLENGKVCYSSLTLDEYLADNPTFKVVDNDEYDRLHKDFFTKSFTEITLEKWDDMLECLPPVKWHTIAGRWNVFFMSEMQSGNITSLFVKDYKTKKCYEGWKDVRMNDEHILADIKKEILQEG